MGQHEEFIEKKAEVTHFMVVEAKAYFLKKIQGAEVFDTETLISQFLEEIDEKFPKEINTGLKQEPEESQLRKIATSIAWIQASSEAIWNMINASVILPCHDLFRKNATVMCKSERGSNGMNFDKLMIPVPAKVTLSPTYRWNNSAVLSDGDLFIRKIDISNLNIEVEQALRESVACFRAELYTAALAMLGKASEGAWLDLGASLIPILPEEKQGANLKKMDDPHFSILGKIQTIVENFRSIAPARDLAKASGINPGELQQVVVWSDVVRDSRNTIHFGVAPAMPNNYEKVGVLLIAAVAHLRLLYVLKAKCAGMHP